MSTIGRHHSITRRTALGRMLVAGAAAAVPPAVGLGEKQGASGAVHVERQPTGAEIWQVTTDHLSHSNIYCEVPYCSSDSRYFVYQRQNPKLSGNRTEFMAVELGTWKQHRLDVATGTGGCAISHDGLFYYLKRTDDGEVELMRADLADGSIEKVYRLADDVRVRSLGTVSTDRRYYASGTKTDPGWTMFDILLVDLEKGEQKILDRDPFILNPHPQFEPGEGRTLMIQHNRGGKYSPSGEMERLVGPEGATLYLLSVPQGKRTELQVGTPYTTPCTGHEAWIGNTREILLTVSARDEYAPEKGNLLAIRSGGPARVVARGYRFAHVGVSRCGRLFSCDDFQGAYQVVIGSNRTGQTGVVCQTKTSPTRSQSTHPHPYLTPDLKWVIFNSNRTGFPHVYAASVPQGMIDRLTAG
jgi:hypothetical protein